MIKTLYPGRLLDEYHHPTWSRYCILQEENFPLEKLRFIPNKYLVLSCTEYQINLDDSFSYHLYLKMCEVKSNLIYEGRIKRLSQNNWIVLPWANPKKLKI